MATSREATAAVTMSHGAPFEFQRITLDVCRPTEVLVRIVAVGVCHTDLSIRDGHLPIPPLPVVLGHEGAGIVEEVGAKVEDLRPGDPVIISFASCGNCDSCTHDEPSRCVGFVMANLRGSRPDNSPTLSGDGRSLSGNFFGQSSFATHALTEARQVVRVPEDLPLAVLAPLGCGIQTGAGAVLNRLKPETGSSIAIFGAGAVGLSSVMAAKVAGCRPIVVVDLNAQRLELAKELGATHAIDPRGTDVVQEIVSITTGGAQHVIEATGAGAAVTQAIQSVRAGGNVCLLGLPAPEATVTLSVAALMAGTIQSVVEGDSTPRVFIPRLIQLFREGRFPFDRLIRFYQFSEINRAADDSAAGRVIKPVLRVSDAQGRRE